MVGLLAGELDAVSLSPVSAVDLAHAARPEGREDFVRAEFVAR
jgi:hypothetical protein